MVKAAAFVGASATRGRRPGAHSAARAMDEPSLRWDPLLVWIAGYVLMSVGRVHQLFGFLEPLHLALLTGVVAIVLYLCDPLEERRSTHVLVPTTKYLLALLVWMMLCVPGALRVGNSFQLLFGNFVKTVLMYFVVAASIRGIRDAERMAGVYLAAVATYAAVVFSRFDVGDGDAWRLGRLYYYDANDFATLAVTAIPIGLYFVHAGRRLRTKLLSALALAVLTVTFVRSGSRGGFLALMAVGSFIVLRYSAVALRWRLALLTLVGLALYGTASDAYWKQMGTIVSDADYNHTEESGRLEIWHRGVGYMLDNPLFGVGPNNFGVAEGTLSPFADRQQFGVGVRWNAAHNSYIQIGAELGIPGLILLVATIISAFAALHRSGRRGAARADAQPEGTPLVPALTASLVGFVVGAFFLSLAYSEMLYTLLALTVGLRKGIDQATSEAPEGPSPRRVFASPALGRARAPMGTARGALALPRPR